MRSQDDTTQQEEGPALDIDEQQLVLRWCWPEQKTVILKGSQLRIGRGSACPIQLSGPSVSREHAQLYRQGPSFVLQDLRSTNGTWLDGRRIEYAPVRDDSLIRVGDWLGFVSRIPRDSIEHRFSELADGIWGGSELASTLGPLKRGARSGLPVLITGATGTGKERFARAVHHFSSRSGRFLALNCAALPEQLAEAELFGYRRGAFTGAERGSEGHFRAAHLGTLFLDELGDLSFTLQAKLLRVIEDGQVQSLGESASVRVDVRIVAALQPTLASLVAAKKFRSDLAVRLSGIPIRLPPLCQRKADIPQLFLHFMKQETGGYPPHVDVQLVETLCLQDWPGNVRQLELTTKSLLALHGEQPKLLRSHLPADILEQSTGRSSVQPVDRSKESRPREEYEFERIQEALRDTNGNIKAAAATLGISRQRVYRVLDSQRSAEQRCADGVSDDAAIG